MTVLYRLEMITYAAPCDEFGDSYGEGRSVLMMYEYEIVRYTPKGAWIYGRTCGESFVNLRANKQFACGTKTDAIESFKARKNRQLEILDGQIRRAKLGLQLLEGFST